MRDSLQCQAPQCHAAKAADLAEQALSLIHQLAALVEAEPDLEPYGDVSLENAAMRRDCCWKNKVL